jgi:nitrous oxidase accessory protein NosD
VLAPLVLALLAPAGALHADLCLVPGDYSTITAAVAAAECTEVSVQAGSFSENVTIQRSLSLHGIDTSSTILEGRLQVEGSAVEVTLADLTLDVAGCFATGLTVSGEAQVQMPSGPVEIIDSGGGSSCPVFQDGFESGDTAAWSVTVP